MTFVCCPLFEPSMNFYSHISGELNFIKARVTPNHSITTCKPRKQHTDACVCGCIHVQYLSFIVCFCTLLIYVWAFGCFELSSYAYVPGWPNETGVCLMPAVSVIETAPPVFGPPGQNVQYSQHSISFKCHKKLCTLHSFLPLMRNT